MRGRGPTGGNLWRIPRISSVIPRIKGTEQLSLEPIGAQPRAWFGRAIALLRFEWVLFGIVFAAVAWMIIPPLLILVNTSLRVTSSADDLGYSLQNYRVVANSLVGGASLLANSVVFALGSAGAAVLLGTTIAWFAERTNAPFRGLAYLAAFSSFAIPGIIQIIAWVLLLGPQSGFINRALAGMVGAESGPFNVFSMSGMIMVEAFSWAPVVFLLMATPFRAMDPALEESAAMSGANAWWTFSRVTFRLALPTVAAVLFLSFVRAFQAFETAAIIGIPAGIEVFTTRIFLVLAQGFFPRYGEGSAYAVVLVVLVGLALLPYYRLSRVGERYATISGKGFTPRRLELGRWRPLGGALMLLLPGLLLLPVLAMLWASFQPFVQPPSLEALGMLTFDNFVSAFSISAVPRSILNTLIVSGVSACVVVLLTVFAAWLVIRTRIRGRRLLDFLATLPLVFPGIVLGLAVLRTYLAVPIPIHGTVWIIVVAFVAKFLPYGMRYNHAGLLSVHRELEESAQMSGAPLGMVVRVIVAPLLAPALVATWIYVFLMTSHELSEAVLLTTPGNEIVSITIWDFWRNGQLGELTAFSVVMTAALATLAVVFRFVADRVGTGSLHQ